MDYRRLDTLRQKHPAWRLLTADHAPLVVSFLHHGFVAPNLRTMAQPELVSRLDDHLYRLRAELGAEMFPRRAEHYLDDWASDEHGWLRKYYPPDGDIPHFDITPATERAIGWLAGLEQRPFVGTESRLMTVFELLRQLVEGTETDPGARIAELERRKRGIDAEISRIRNGQLDLLDATRIRERFLQMAGTARGLLSDFRELEQNFRDLDRAVRERIATWDGTKGALLEEVFGEREAIIASDQGRSFKAFWDFLMSPSRQEELSRLLSAVFELQPVRDLEPDGRLLRVHYDWLEAGEVAQRTVARLSEQLRRYLDDQAWLENRRIMQILREIEQGALLVRDRPPDGSFMELDGMSPEISLPMDRRLFSRPLKPLIEGEMAPGETVDVPVDLLFEQVHVDKDRLEAQIRRALQTLPQIALTELVDAHPLEQGLAELVAYLSLAADDRGAIIDDAHRRTLAWTDDEGRSRQATMPLVIFSRTGPASAEAR